MNFKSILITGGAGFVGSNLAVFFKRDFESVTVTCMDSLKRRGSELCLGRLRENGIDFIHGDIRCPDDFEQLPKFDLMIDCSAEPSVHAGISGGPSYLLDTNLTGTLNCLEAARKNSAAVIFLSTSRVYPITTINNLQYEETETRFTLSDIQTVPGCSANGFTEDFPLCGARSMYGASKLAAELILQEYVYSYSMPAIINRCGILTGPWQMGKVDQGVTTLWVARHEFEKPLRYTGFGGTGKQVRDMLHVEDLYDLLVKQCSDTAALDGSVYNVGGGLEVSSSLCELTEVCREVTGNTIDIASQPETSPVDLRLYLTDSSKVKATFGWTPERDIRRIVADIHAWIMENRTALENILG